MYVLLLSLLFYEHIWASSPSLSHTFSLTHTHTHTHTQVRHTGVAGERLREAGKINTSLLTLSRIIKSLASGNQAHLGFRDSKLTRLLQESLTGKTRTALIACATPSAHYIEETKSTLLFAQRAKTVKTCAEVNEILDDAAMLKRLRRDLKKAQQELESLKDGKQNEDTIEEMRVREKRSIEERERLEAQLSKLEKEKEAAMRTVTNLKRNLLCSTKCSTPSVVSSNIISTTTTTNNTNNTAMSTNSNQKDAKRSRKQFRETWCPGTHVNDSTFRAVQEFRRELDNTIVSKFQDDGDDDDDMDVENLDIMQLENVPESDIVAFCQSEQEVLGEMSRNVEQLSRKNQEMAKILCEQKEETSREKQEMCVQIQDMSKQIQDMFRQSNQDLAERDAKICSLSKQLQELSSKNIDIVNLSKQLQELRQLNSIKDSEILRFQEDVRSHAEMTQEFQAKCEDMRLKNKKLCTTLDTNTKEREELLCQTETLRYQLDESRKFMLKIEKEKSEFQSKFEEEKLAFQIKFEKMEKEKLKFQIKFEEMKKEKLELQSTFEEEKLKLESTIGADSEITRAISAELESKDQEIDSLKTQIAAISGESSKLSAENLEMTRRIEVMNVQLEDLETCAKMKDTMSELREKLEMSENQNDAMEATIMARDEKIREMGLEIQEIAQSKIEMEQKILLQESNMKETTTSDELREKLNISENQVDALEATIMARDEKIREMDLRFQEMGEVSEEKTQELERTVQEREEKIREMSEELVRVTEELASLEETRQSVDERDEKIREMSEELVRVTEELASMEETRHGIKTRDEQIQEMSTEMERVTEELASMEEEKTQLKDTIKELNGSLKDSQKRIAKLESVKLTESQVARMIEMKKEWKALKKEKKQGLWNKSKDTSSAQQQHKAEVEALEDRVSGLTAQKRKLKETLAKRDSALKQAREMMKEIHSELADAKTVRAELEELKQKLSESNAELEKSQRDVRSLVEIQAQANESASEVRKHKALVQRLREDNIRIQADIETLRKEQNEMETSLKKKDTEIQRIRKHVQVLEKENLDLMLKSENLDVAVHSKTVAADSTTTTNSKQEYSFNDNDTFDDEGLLLGDNSLMEDVRAAVASECEKENAGRIRSTKKRRRKRGLTPAKSNVIINDDAVSVKKKQKLSSNDDILAATEEPKRRQRNEEVRPAILSQPAADGDNPECAQQ